MRILIFGSEYFKLFSNVLNFDENQVVLFFEKNDQQVLTHSILSSNFEKETFNSKNMIDIDFSKFDGIDLFIVASSNDNLNALFIHRLDQEYPDQEKILFIKDPHFAELQRDFGFNVLSTNELLREKLVDFIGGLID
jgi:hypothetical protein|tara:strand:- start:250 stop:660 length:411 start_codon:yes stop_codon:yes gene_type:complete